MMCNVVRKTVTFGNERPKTVTEKEQTHNFYCNTVFTTLSTVSEESLVQNSNNMQFNSEQACFNSSINVALDPKPKAYLVEDNIIEEEVTLPTQIKIPVKTTTVKSRGCPPLSEEEKNKRAVAKASKTSN